MLRARWYLSAVRVYDGLAHGHGRGPKSGCLPSGAGYLPIPERPPGNRTRSSPAGASLGDPGGHAEVQFVPILPELPYWWPGKRFFSYIFFGASRTTFCFFVSIGKSSLVLEVDHERLDFHSANRERHTRLPQHGAHSEIHVGIYHRERALR